MGLKKLRKRYAQARNDPQSRPSFLRKILFSNFSEYVSHITYSPATADAEEHDHYPYKSIPRIASSDRTTVMEVIPTRQSEFDFIPGTKSQVVVYAPAFEDYQFEEFLTALLIHEGTHAKEYFLTPQLIEGISAKVHDTVKNPLVKTLIEVRKDITNAECEIRAYSAELDTPWHVRRRYRNDLLEMLQEEKTCREKLIKVYNELILDVPSEYKAQYRKIDF